MTATHDHDECLCSAIQGDFVATRRQLTEARLRLSRKDSLTNRASVAECWARIDTLLDMLLEAETACP